MKRKQVVKGGNTNLYKTRIKPKKTIRTKKYKKTRGGGVLDFLKSGLKHITSKKIPSSLLRITKNAVKKGAQLAKNELRKPVVQKALKTAVSEGSKLLADRVLSKATGKKSPSLRDDIISRIAEKASVNNRNKLRRRKRRNIKY